MKEAIISLLLFYYLPLTAQKVIQNTISSDSTPKYQSTIQIDEPSLELSSPYHYERITLSDLAKDYVIVNNDVVTKDRPKIKEIGIMQFVDKDTAAVTKYSIPCDSVFQCNSENILVMGEGHDVSIMRKGSKLEIMPKHIHTFFLYSPWDSVLIRERLTFEPYNIDAICFRMANAKYIQVASMTDLLAVDGGAISTLNLEGARIRRFMVLDNVDLEELKLKETRLPDTCYFANLKLSNLRKPIDLSSISNTSTVHLMLKNVDLNKFIIPYNRVMILIESSQTYENKVIMLQQILKGIEDQGLTETYEIYDKILMQMKLLHRYPPIVNFISKYWWDYGYDKFRVVLNSLYFFLFFSLINIFLYKRLIAVYCPKGFIKFENEYSRAIITTNQWKGKILLKTGRLLSIILYTSYLFWGLKLSLEDVAIKKWGIILLILLEYSLGLVCVAYIANYIITR